MAKKKKRKDGTDRVTAGRPIDPEDAWIAIETGRPMPQVRWNPKEVSRWISTNKLNKDIADWAVEREKQGRPLPDAAEQRKQRAEERKQRAIERAEQMKLYRKLVEQRRQQREQQRQARDQAKEELRLLREQRKQARSHEQQRELDQMIKTKLTEVTPERIQQQRSQASKRCYVRRTTCHNCKQRTSPRHQFCPHCGAARVPLSAQ